jgi:hypothetical protein
MGWQSPEGLKRGAGAQVIDTMTREKIQMCPNAADLPRTVNPNRAGHQAIAASMFTDLRQ